MGRVVYSPSMFMETSVYLKRLEIIGFKTFANRTVIDFPAGITAIVGPNGSGKSNVTDAIRWVLGEQSYSALRCRKTEDLIFSGGSRRAPLGLAEVSLTIDNTDRTLPLPFNAVTITRRSHRSGENEYYINKSKVRLRDIQEATAPLAQSYTLINQGMVDAALTLRPDERRSLFEDAAAISVSVSKRAEAERRLRQTEENLSRLLDLLAELEPRLRTLKRQAREAEQVHELETTLHAALKRHYQRQWHSAQQQRAATEQQVLQSQQRLATLREQQQHSAAEIAAARKAVEHAQAELELHASALAEQQQTLATTEREYAVLHERLQALQQRAGELAEQSQQIEAEIIQLETQQTDQQAQIASEQAQLRAAQAELQALEQQEQATLNARRTSSAALDQAREQAASSASTLAAAQNRAAQVEQRRETLGADIANVERELQTLQAQLTAQQAAQSQAFQVLEEAEAAAQASEQAESAAQQQIAQARQERKQAEAEVSSARREVDVLQSRLEALRRTIASGAGMFSGVKAALHWAERQQHSDFALVASIIEVPAELETALEVTLGGRLQNIVVERWDDAEAAISELKRSDAGRATFLPLDTLRVSRPQPAPTGPGILGLASQLVHYAERYERVVQYLLGRTLVVADLATARRVLREIDGNWSIVTVHGEQVSSAGAMTGGGRIRETGTLRRERELRELPQQIEQAQAALSTHINAVHAAEAAIASAEQAARQAEHARRSSRSALEQARETLARQTHQLERNEQERSWYTNRLESLQAEQAQLAETLRVAYTEIEQANQADAAAQAAVEAARLQAETAREAGQASEQRLLAARTALATRQAAYKAAQQSLQTLQTALQRLRSQQQQVQQRTHTTASEINALEQQQHTLEQQRTAQHASVAAAQENYAPLLGSRDKAQASLTSHELHERELSEALITAQTALGRAETSLAQANARCDQIWERCAEENIDIEQLGDQPLNSDVPAEEDQATIEQLRNRLKRMGTINPLAPQEYAEAQERHEFLSTQVADVQQAAEGLRELIAELETAMQSRFSQTVAAVAEEFSATFTRLFGGGTAQLVLDETTQGIDIIAQPPGKRRQPLSLLSGGERSLTAVALLVALLRVNPTPFCVMDEVDAALDEANVVRLRELLSEMSEQTQFIISRSQDSLGPG